VAALLRSFPARTGEDSPDLTLVRAIADQYQLRLDQTDAHLREVRAYAATTPSASQRRLQMAIASVDLLSARLRGHFDSVVEQAGALLCPGDGPTSADAALSSDLKAIALLNLGVTEAWSLRLADSERHLAEGAALARRIGRPYLEVACLAHAGFASTGHSFATARQRCEEAITVAARHGWDAEAVTAPALAALANALIWTGQFDPPNPGWTAPGAPHRPTASPASGPHRPKRQATFSRTLESHSHSRRGCTLLRGELLFRLAMQASLMRSGTWFRPRTYCGWGSR
jgi:LuxR family transcriptional regulator, maltose regulon positive regulatory protein